MNLDKEIIKQLVEYYNQRITLTVQLTDCTPPFYEYSEYYASILETPNIKIDDKDYSVEILIKDLEQKDNGSFIITDDFILNNTYIDIRSYSYKDGFIDLEYTKNIKLNKFKIDNINKTVSLFKKALLNYDKYNIKVTSFAKSIIDNFVNEVYNSKKDLMLFNKDNKFNISDYDIFNKTILNYLKEKLNEKNACKLLEVINDLYNNKLYNP